MKRSIELMAVAAAVLLFGFATSAPAQRLPGIRVEPPTASPRAGLGRVYVPDSSIAKAGSTGVSAHTNVEVFVPDGFKPDVFPVDSGYGYNTPASYMCRYNFPTSSYHIAGCNPNNPSLLTLTTGGSETIAIVDAYDDPWAAVDLAYFSAVFGIPFNPSKFQVVYAAGYEPGQDFTGGWELEESLDIEWAHAMAPNANIVLVEANSNQYSDLTLAVQVASCEVVYGNPGCTGTPTGAGEVSMSWGGSEFSGETSYDGYFGTTSPGQPNVVYFAASGDSPGVIYPCASSNVVCVGGTTFSRNPYTLNGEQEGTWEDAGGGQSAYEALPSYQSGITGTLSGLSSLGINTAYRAVPDVSAIANPNTGVWVWDSFDFELYGYGNALTGWWVVGGTSVSTPVFAGMVNQAGSFKASSNAELTQMYSAVSGGGSTIGAGFADVIPDYGVCGPYQGFTALVGYDLCTGIGTPSGTANK
jgi:subtilase family serine protease